jgi:hypothetical protein
MSVGVGRRLTGSGCSEAGILKAREIRLVRLGELEVRSRVRAGSSKGPTNVVAEIPNDVHEILSPSAVMVRSAIQDCQGQKPACTASKMRTLACVTRVRRSHEEGESAHAGLGHTWCKRAGARTKTSTELARRRRQREPRAWRAGQRSGASKRACGARARATANARAHARVHECVCVCGHVQRRSVEAGMRAGSRKRCESDDDADERQGEAGEAARGGRGGRGRRERERERERERANLASRRTGHAGRTRTPWPMPIPSLTPRRVLRRAAILSETTK